MTTQTPQWHRNDDVLWRVGADRVLVRVVGGPGLDLVGTAALVWVALDEPATADEICNRLDDAGLAPTAVDDAVTMLTAAALISATATS